jgi:hypothetical protein
MATTNNVRRGGRRRCSSSRLQATADKRRRTASIARKRAARGEAAPKARGEFHPDTRTHTQVSGLRNVHRVAPRRAGQCARLPRALHANNVRREFLGSPFSPPPHQAARLENTVRTLEDGASAAAADHLSNL